MGVAGVVIALWLGKSQVQSAGLIVVREFPRPATLADAIPVPKSAWLCIAIPLRGGRHHAQAFVEVHPIRALRVHTDAVGGWGLRHGAHRGAGVRAAALHRGCARIRRVLSRPDRRAVGLLRHHASRKHRGRQKDKEPRRAGTRACLAVQTPAFSIRAKKNSRRLARVNALAEKLRFLPHLSEDERVLYAWSLAATPDERWRRHENFLRSHGLFMHSARKRSGLSS